MLTIVLVFGLLPWTWDSNWLKWLRTSSEPEQSSDKFCQKNMSTSCVKVYDSRVHTFLGLVKFWANVYLPAWGNPPFPVLSCLHMLSAPLTRASPPHTVPSLPSFLLCLPKSFSDITSSLSLKFFLADCTEPWGGYSPGRALQSPLYLCYYFSRFPLVASLHLLLYLPRGIKAHR